MSRQLAVGSWQLAVIFSEPLCFRAFVALI